jgi:hypothetical protein
MVVGLGTGFQRKTLAQAITAASIQHAQRGANMAMIGLADSALSQR